MVPRAQRTRIDWRVLGVGVDYYGCSHIVVHVVSDNSLAHVSSVFIYSPTLLQCFCYGIGFSGGTVILETECTSLNFDIELRPQS